MRLRFRLLWLIVETVFKKRRSLADENVLNMRVLPNDVDVTRVSNDRYLTFMDLGRISIVLQAGLLRTLVRQRWGPVARVVSIRFRYPLTVFQRFQLRTRAIYWDNEWVWFEQRFERRGRTTAIGLVKATLAGPDGLVTPARIIAAAGEAFGSPPLPKVIADLQNVERQLREYSVDAV